MAKVDTFGLSLLTKLTTSYFYFGDTLQQMTALAFEATFIIIPEISF